MADSNRYTMRDGAIWKGDQRMLVLVRALWGDGAPSHAALAEAEADIARIINAHEGGRSHAS